MMATEPRETRPAVKLFGGRYTIESKQTGEHRTFWVRTQEADAEFAPGRRLVMLLTGSQNDDLDSYTAFGFAEEAGIRVFPSKQASSPRWAQFADLLWTLALDGAFSAWAEKGFKIAVEKRCLRCDRVLTNPNSLKTGIGPICEGM